MVHVEYVIARYTEARLLLLVTKNNNFQVCFSHTYTHAHIYTLKVTFLKTPETLVTKMSAEFI